MNTPATVAVLEDVLAERHRQHEKWGYQAHPNGTGGPELIGAAEVARAECELAFHDGRGTYRHILAEEVAEALAESNPWQLRAELVQVAAVAVQWAEHLDRTACREADVPLPSRWTRLLCRLLGHRGVLADAATLRFPACVRCGRWAR